MAKIKNVKLTITNNAYGHDIDLVHESNFATISFHDFEFIAGGAILFHKFAAFNSKRRLEFAAIRTNMNTKDFMELWHKVVLTHLDSGLDLPFLEFVCDGIQLHKQQSENNIDKYAMQLVNCWSRTKQITSENESPNKIRDVLNLDTNRAFATVHLDNTNRTVFFKGVFYHYIGREFKHNRLRLKVVNLLALEGNDKYKEYKDAEITDRKTSNFKAA